MWPFAGILTAKLFIKSQLHLAGIYIHIPFCRQACHYCNFHFATSLRYKNELIASLLKETVIRKDYLAGETVDTIYFGGGTPSLLDADEISSILDLVGKMFRIAGDVEVTLEANPDDITTEKLMAWKASGINRLSIGIQSFYEEDLTWMNRAHNARQAIDSLELARKYFDNITVDLIYGTPQLTDEKWKHNVERVIAMEIPHLSCYALTVEPKTPLQKMISSQKAEDIDPGRQSDQFLLLMDWMENAGYDHYEISNFARPGRRSRHNSSYWQGKRYLGLGPSAHSFDGHSRQWNISNNKIYIDSLTNGLLSFEMEELTGTQQVNEYIMTSLRTMEGLSLDRIGQPGRQTLLEIAGKYIQTGHLLVKEGNLVLSKEGKLLADGIAAALFF
jgi:oxygen-independent coproporphyrinogen-3 oxidase